MLWILRIWNTNVTINYITKTVHTINEISIHKYLDNDCSMEKKYNENEAQNYYEKSFPKVLFDSLGSNYQNDGLDVNNRTKDGMNEINSKARKVIRVL